MVKKESIVLVDWLNNFIKLVVAFVITLGVSVALGAIFYNLGEFLGFNHYGIDMLSLLLGLIIFISLGYKLLPKDIKNSFKNW